MISFDLIELSEVMLKVLEGFRKMLDCGLGAVDIGGCGNFVVAFHCCCYCCYWGCISYCLVERIKRKDVAQALSRRQA